MEFLKQVLGVFNSLGVDEDGGESKKVEMLVNKMASRETQVDTMQEERKELERKLKSKEEECEVLKKQLEVAKWARLDAEVNLNELGTKVVQVYKRIEEVVETVQDSDDEVEILEDSPTNGTYTNIFKLLKKLKDSVENKVKKLEESREELKQDLEKVKECVEGVGKMLEEQTKKIHQEEQVDTVNKFYVPVMEVDEPNLDIVVEEVEIGEDVSRDKPTTPAPRIELPSPPKLVDPPRPGPPSTVPLSHQAEPISDDEDEAPTSTMTFYQSTPPPTQQYPQAEFRSSLRPNPLRYPSILPPAPLPQSVIQFAAQLPLRPPPSSCHAVDSTRRQIGFFCTCGLECSTKKTLQYHIRAHQRLKLQQQQPFVRQDFLSRAETTSSSMPPPSPPQQNLKSLLQSPSRMYTVAPPTPSPPTLTVPIHYRPPIYRPFDAYNDPIQCRQCPDEFSKQVQYRLHQKIKQYVIHVFYKNFCRLINERFIFKFYCILQPYCA